MVQSQTRLGPFQSSVSSSASQKKCPRWTDRVNELWRSCSPGLGVVSAISWLDSKFPSRRKPPKMSEGRSSAYQAGIRSLKDSSFLAASLGNQLCIRISNLPPKVPFLSSSASTASTASSFHLPIFQYPARRRSHSVSPTFIAIFFNSLLLSHPTATTHIQDAILNLSPCLGLRCHQCLRSRCH